MHDCPARPTDLRPARIAGLLTAAVVLCGCPGDGGGTGTTSGSESSGGSTGSSSTASTTDATATTTMGSGSEDTSGGTSTSAADSSGGSSSTGGEVELRGPCELATKVGSFQVGMEAAYSAFAGSVADGVVPISVLEQVGQDGECVLLRRNNPFCDPTCTAGETCDFDGMCIPYPANHDVGVVSVDGLLQPVSVDPTPPTYAYYDTSLPNPAFEPEAAVRLDAAGGDYEAFTLYGFGVDMVAPTAVELMLSSGMPVTVEWTPSGSAHARLHLVLSVDQHGLTPVQLVCDGDDDGSLEISAALVTQFLDFGVSGFPAADYYLQTADSVDIAPGCVEFVVRSHEQTPLSVAGHTPCNGPDDCPPDQTCNIMLQTCE